MIPGHAACHTAGDAATGDARCVLLQQASTRDFKGPLLVTPTQATNVANALQDVRQRSVSSVATSGHTPGSTGGCADCKPQTHHVSRATEPPTNKAVAAMIKMIFHTGHPLGTPSLQGSWFGTGVKSTVLRLSRYMMLL